MLGARVHQMIAAPHAQRASLAVCLRDLLHGARTLTARVRDLAARERLFVVGLRTAQQKVSQGVFEVRSCTLPSRYASID